MNRLLVSTLTLALAATLAAAKPAAKPAVKPAKKAAASSADGLKTDDERTFYSYGYKLGQNLSPLSPSEGEARAISQGLRDAAGGKGAAVNVQLYLPKVSEMAQTRMSVKSDAEKKKGAAFVEKYKAEPGVSPITGGGYIKTLTAGTGAMPGADDTVKVNYRGTLIDGTEFDSSYKRNEPTSFPLKGVIPCWTNGVAQMKVGGKSKLVCPSDVAYGDSGHPPVIPGGATLVFEIELLDVVKADAPKMDAQSAAPAAPKSTPAGKK